MENQNVEVNEEQTQIVEKKATILESMSAHPVKTLMFGVLAGMLLPVAVVGVGIAIGTASKKKNEEQTQAQNYGYPNYPEKDCEDIETRDFVE